MGSRILADVLVLDPLRFRAVRRGRRAPGAPLAAARVRAPAGRALGGMDRAERWHLSAHADREGAADACGTERVQRRTSWTTTCCLSSIPVGLTRNAQLVLGCVGRGGERRGVRNPRAAATAAPLIAPPQCSGGCKPSQRRTQHSYRRRGQDTRPRSILRSRAIG